jgi:hypothetical protein
MSCGRYQLLRRKRSGPTKDAADADPIDDLRAPHRRARVRRSLSGVAVVSGRPMTPDQLDRAAAAAGSQTEDERP